ncbi:MAG: DHHA1 domain-containing protein, partial [Pontibacterium sp.]
ATRTGDIGFIKLVSEGGVAAGVRRVEAVTGKGALAWVEDADLALAEIAGVVKANRDGLAAKVIDMAERNKVLEKELAQLKSKLAQAQSADLINDARDIAGVKVLSAKLEGVEPKALRDTIDQFKNKLGNGVVVLVTEADGKVSLAAGVTKALSKQVKAGDLVRELTGMLGGKGGGRPDFAQGGGADANAVPAALEKVYELVSAALEA